jgi:hypothetical protein
MNPAVMLAPAQYALSGRRKALAVSLPLIEPLLTALPLLQSNS